MSQGFDQQCKGSPLLEVPSEENTPSAQKSDRLLVECKAPSLEMPKTIEKFKAGSLPSRDRYKEKIFTGGNIDTPVSTLDAVASAYGEAVAVSSQIARAAVPVRRASSLLRAVAPALSKVLGFVPGYPKFAIMVGSAAEFLMDRTPKGFAKFALTAAIGVASWKANTIAIAAVTVKTVALGFPPIAVTACTLGVVALGATAGYLLWQGTLAGIDRVFEKKF